MEVWNSWKIKPPPVCTIKTFLYHKEINNCKDVLFNALKTLKDSDYIHKEAAMLSRFLYKHKRTFRHDKGIQNLIKINQCLKRYLNLNLVDTISIFKQGLPAKLLPSATHAYLPTRQMLKWILLRLQAFSQIFKRIIEISKETGLYFYQKLFLGWSLNLTLFIFSATARILTLSKYLLAKSIEWYNTLYKYLPYFELTADYLPNYKFPVDLKKWLGEVDISPPNKKSSIDKVFEIIDLVQEEDDEESDNEEVKILNENFLKSLFKLKINENDCDIEEVEIKKAREVKKSKEKKRINHQHAVSYCEDLGVPIDQEDVIEIPSKKRKLKNS